MVPRLRTTGSAITCSASRDDRKEAGHVGGFEERCVAGQRAHPQLVAVAEDEFEFDQVVDVDQPLWSGQAELHHRQQAVPAGDDPRLGAVPCKECKSIVPPSLART